MMMMKGIAGLKGEIDDRKLTLRKSITVFSEKATT